MLTAGRLLATVNDSTLFSPRLEAHGKSTTVLGTPTYSFAELPALPRPLFTAIPGGNFYNQSYNFDTTSDVNGNFNDTRNFYTQTSQAEYFEITLQTDLTTKHEGVTIYIDQTANPDVVSSTNHFTLAATAATYLTYAVYASTDDIWVLNSNGSTYDLTFKIDWNLGFGSRPIYTLNSTFKDRLWNGRVNVVFDLTTGVPNRVDITHPTTVRLDDFAYGQWVPSWSGWDGRSGYVGRPILDMKTGLPTFAEEVVEDGYLDGVWTVPAQWDPIDPRDVREVVFPDDEGTRKDDVPA